jgi:hypothetical protein
MCCPSRCRPTSGCESRRAFPSAAAAPAIFARASQARHRYWCVPRGVRQRASNKSADTHCLLAPPRHGEPTIKFSPVHLSAPIHSPPDCRVVPLRCGRCGRQAYETLFSAGDLQNIAKRPISGSPSTHARRRHSPAASVATTRRGAYIIVAR